MAIRVTAMPRRVTATPRRVTAMAMDIKAAKVREKKWPAEHCFAGHFACRKRPSRRFQIGRFHAARIGLNVERHALTFNEAAHSSRLDGGGVYEHVFPAAFRSDKTKPFSSIEKLY